MLVEHSRVDVAVPPTNRTTVLGFNAQVGPLVTTGDTVAVILTLPEKPPKLVRVIVEFTAEPGPTFKWIGLEVMEKHAPAHVQAVTGCISHPEYQCPVSFMWPGSQKTKPCMLIGKLLTLGGSAGAIPACFQSWS